MWDRIVDFLTFQTFITPALLVTLYLIGAFLVPFISWGVMLWIKKRYFTNIALNLSSKLSKKQKLIIYTLFILSFLCMEIFWRMMFEILIAYFDMHDALMKIAES